MNSKKNNNMSNIQFPILSFQELIKQENVINQMTEIFKEVHLERTKTYEKGYINDPTNYKAVAAYPEINIGRVFLAKEGNNILGYMFCLDSVDLDESKKYPIRFISKYLTHEYKFIKDLSILGNFGFVNQFAIRDGFRSQGIGEELLQVCKKFYTNKTVLLLASVVHERHRLIINFLSKRDFMFVDYYMQQTTDTLWHRVVKIINRSSFFKSINAKSLPKTFNTVIPIQLNIATSNINKVLEKIGAKILWSSFFQYEYPILSKVFNMDRNYNGYYDTLVNCPEENFNEVITILKEIYVYLKNKDSGDTSLASLSPSLKNNGYEFFLINDNKETYNFKKSFANPIVLNIHELCLDNLVIESKLEILKQISNKDLEKWNQILLKKGDHARYYKAIKKSKNDYEGIIDREKHQANIKRRLFELESLWSKEEKNWLSTKILFDIVNKRKINAKNITSNSSSKENYENIKLIKELLPKKQLSWANWINLHKKMYKADSTVVNDDLWCHAVIPMSFAGGVSGIMFTFKCKKDETAPSILEDISYLISNAFTKNMFNIILKLQNSIMQKYLMKFSISNIMTRNLSHNLGSHVLAKISSPKNLDKLIRDERGKISTLTPISDFNIYMRTRMDFLADVSTSEPVSSLSRKLNNDVISVIQKEDILLKHISGTNLKKIKILYKNTIHQFKPDKDIYIQMPNGDLGNHALFVIIENIIRNCVKHENSSFASKNSLTITIEVKDDPRKKMNSPKKSTDRNYKLLIYDNVLRDDKKAKKLVTEINQSYINEPIIIDRHKIRSRGWGLIEMKIAAAYLRKKIPSEVIDVNNLNPPLLKAVCVPTKHNESDKKNKSKKQYIGYEIYLKKPRELLIIDSSETASTDSERMKNWINLGVKIISLDDIKDSNEAHSHQIVLLFDDEDRAKIETYKNFPFRWLIINNKKEQQQIKDEITKNISVAMNKIWSKWLKRFLKNKNLIDLKFDPILNKKESIEDINLLIEKIPKKNLLLFDLHGKASKLKIITPKKLPYYEAFSSVSAIGSLINSYEKLKKVEQERLTLELKEAAVTSILLLDERIQEEIVETNPNIEINKSSSLEQLEWMNIFIPDPKKNKDNINLYKENFSEQEQEQVNNWIKQKLLHSKIDFVVIHLGIIEKMIGTDHKDLKKYIEDHILAHDNRPEIIIISGRGVPHDLPPNVSFLHYSNLAKYILEDRSKFHLVKLLFSARYRIGNYDI